MQKKNLISPFKLTKAHKAAISGYLTGQANLTDTYQRMGISKQRLYTMIAHMMHHSCATGRINTKDVLRDY